MVKKLRSAAIASLLLGAALAVDAAGLGKLTVNSSLGQVLNAEIDLVSLQPGELDSVTARVAPPESFREARIEYTAALRLIRFSVEKRPNGQPYLKVTSVAPINEPFVDMLVEVSWPAGRIQREYPILLDPPGYAQAKVAPPAVAKAPAETPPAEAPAAASSAPAEPAAGGPSAKEEMPVQSPTAGDTYGPVEKGDTLNKIATQVKPESVSLEQMLVALYRENKGAFINNNMNRLRTGQILKVPAAEDVGKIEVPEARREYRTHVADWRAYREQLAGAVGAIPARPETTQGAAGRITSAAVAPPPTPSAEPKDVLKLSKTADATGSKAAGAAKGGSAAASQERINALQEELTAKDQALREAQSRVADLEKQIRDMQRLVELKGAAPVKPADAKVAATTPPPAVKPAEPPKAAAVKPGEAPKPAEAAKVAEAPKPVEAAKPAEPPKPAAAPPKVAEAPKQPTPAKPAPKKAPAPPPEPSLMDQAMDNLPYIVGGLGLLGLLGFAGFMLNKRRRSAAEVETVGPPSGTSAFPADLKPSTTAVKPGGGLVDTGNSSFLTDFDKTGPGTIDTDEVDPVAEAEVYIAYGRDAQAEEILKEAMARDRNRHEIALKLLEIYHARKSATAFETVAKELRGAVGETSPMWQKAAAMGAQIDPTNPLYAGAAPVAGLAPSAPPPAAPKPDLDFDVAPGGSQSPGSFDLDLEGPKSTPVAPDLPVDSSPALDFDITPSGSPQKMDMPTEQAREEKPAFDFDLSGLELPGSGKSPAAADGGKAKAAASQGMSLDLTDLNLDSPAGDAAGGEAVGTKLELAKAYLEIGDKDGAREILEEVAREGSTSQKDEAKKLISSL